MCALSATIPFYEKAWPEIQTWPLHQVSELQQVLNKLEAIDNRLKLVECRDAEKDAFFVKLKALLEEKMGGIPGP